jgi:CP family cyanate transporter-like MFS transporter
MGLRTNARNGEGQEATCGSFWIASGLLWLAGAGLRMTILAVRPSFRSFIPICICPGRELASSGLPMILFAIAALIARFGAVPTLVTGLLIAGIASGLRGAMLDVLALYATTIVMSAGVAIMQPTFPPLVRRWLRIG